MRRFLTLVFLLFALDSFCLDSLVFIKHGEKLFRTDCLPCHGIGKEKTGPSLASIPKKKPRKWLHSFIRNSQNVILSGDPYANHLFEQYNRNVMPSFSKFTDYDIDAILSFIEYRSLNPVVYNMYEQSDKLFDGKGKRLFMNHCSSCHSLNQEAYGPALASVTKRHTRPWLVSFVQNSTQMIQNGDPYANLIYDNFGKKKMTSFSFLDENSIHQILDYIETSSASPQHIGGVNGKDLNAKNQPSGDLHLSVLSNEKPEKVVDIFIHIAMFLVLTLVIAVSCWVIYSFYKFLMRN
jgi:mono/diheme cytochrome c family protein